MDLSIAALAGKTIAILTPYVARTAAEFVNTVGEAGQTRRPGPGPSWSGFGPAGRENL